MHKLTVTLKQHTPLIHFQHDQEGATLRASEVKPKLDRFIIERAFHNNFEECKKYLVGYSEKEDRKFREKFEKGFRALNYKMRILCPNNRTEYILASAPKLNQDIEIKHLPDNTKILFDVPFFAQEKETYGERINNEITTVIHYETELRQERKNRINYAFSNEIWDNIDKKGIKYDGNIIMELFCQHSELFSLELTKQVESFFIATNLGTRQSKGFGSFTVISIKKGDTEEIPIEKNYLEQLKKIYQFIYSKQTKNFENAFSEIKNDYQLLKAGINFRKYTKSLLYCFSVNNNVGIWEKRKIKTEMSRNGITPFSKTSKNPDMSCCKCHNNTPKNDKFIRALLGLAEHYEFNNSRIYVDVNGGESFQRFKSPITFKIIDNTIYLLGNPIMEDVYSKVFEFQINKKMGGRKTPCGSPFSLQTPDSFNLKAFLEDALIKSGKFKYIKKQSI